MIRTLDYGVVVVRESANSRFDRLIDLVDLSGPNFAMIWVDCEGVVFATLACEGES